MCLNTQRIETTINIIDIEASGLHIDSYPIEIAVSISGIYGSWLIKPCTQWTHWSESAEAIHGISREQLFEEGEEIQAVTNTLGQSLEAANGIIYSDAPEWDEDWLKTLYHAAGQELPVKVASIFELLTADQKGKFHESKSMLRKSGQYQLHRALDDVKLIEHALSVALLDA